VNIASFPLENISFLNQISLNLLDIVVPDSLVVDIGKSSTLHSDLLSFVSESSNLVVDLSQDALVDVLLDFQSSFRSEMSGDLAAKFRGDLGESMINRLDDLGISFKDGTRKRL